MSSIRIEENLLAKNKNQILSELMCDYAAAYHFISEDNDQAQLEWVVGAFEEITGHPIPKAWTNFSLSAPVHPDDMEEFQARQAQLRAGEPSVAEFRILNKNGEVRWLLSRGLPEWDDERQEVTRIYVGVQDITERKKAEENLRKSENQYRQLLETSIQGIVLLQDGRFVYCNPSMSKITGFSVDEMLAMRPDQVINIVHPDDQAEVQANIRHRLAGTRLEPNYKHRIIRADGEVRYVEIYASLTTYRNKPAIQGTYIDITAEKKIENALRENEAQLRLITSNMSDLIIHSDEKGYIKYASPSALKLWDSSSEELIASHFSQWFKLVHPDDSAKLQETFSSRLETGEGPARGLFRIKTSPDEYLWHEYTVNIVENLQGSIVGYTYVIRDVDKRMRAVLALQKSEGRLRQAMNVARLGIWEWDIETDETIWTGEMFRMYGISPEEFTGKGADYLNFTLPEDRQMQQENIARAFQNGLTEKDLIENRVEITYRPNHFRILRPNGSICYVQGDAIAIVDDAGKPLRMIGLLQDITEQRTIEKAMQQAQKLESLGVLAGSVAHDFNNLLTGILSHASLIKSKIGPDSSFDKNIEAIIETAERAADITNQLLAYTGKGRFNITQFSLNELVQKNITLLQATLPKNINLIFDAEEDLPRLTGDIGQIQQVIMNLIINASDAYNGRSGQVKLKTETCHVSGTDIRMWENFGHELQPGAYISLTVTDCGQGMDNPTLSRIFDPFFTTKETGRGLGLAAVQGIIRGHQGALRVSSNVKEGTTFQILFPIKEAEQAEGVRETPTTAVDPENQLILIVDDEEAIRMAAGETLEYYGYRTLLAPNGFEAIDICRQYYDQISLILLDMTMPGLSGQETMAALKENGLIFPIVFMSGYNEQSYNTAKQPGNVIGFLKKPFLIEMLVDTVASALT